MSSNDDGSWHSTSFGGAFFPVEARRVKTLHAAASAAQSYSVADPIVVRPGGSGHGVHEDWKGQPAPSSGTSWPQQMASPSQRISTTYENLSATDLSSLTRSNKVLNKGGSKYGDQPGGSNHWDRDKAYDPQGMQLATQLRVNEASTPLGAAAMQDPGTNAGTGIMADILAQKWQHRASGADTELQLKDMLPGLIEKYPQIRSVQEMRKRQTAEGLIGQIADSRMSAAVAARDRAKSKGLKGYQVGEYVQKKFNKHGLGPVPRGWTEK